MGGSAFQTKWRLLADLKNTHIQYSAVAIRLVPDDLSLSVHLLASWLGEWLVTLTIVPLATDLTGYVTSQLRHGASVELHIMSLLSIRVVPRYRGILRVVQNHLLEL